MEDDSEVAATLGVGLGEHGIDLAHEASIRAGSLRAREGEWDVVVLDVSLPDGSGVELCRNLRGSGNTTPILMLTARDSIADRVDGLEAGADDYLVKPFAFAELVARLRALSRRPTPIQPDFDLIADLRIDYVARRVTRSGDEVRLTAKEFALLEVLARRQGRVVDRPTIGATVWDENHDPFTNVLEVLVRRLRRKIDEGRSEPLLETIRGAGYRLRG